MSSIEEESQVTSQIVAQDCQDVVLKIYKIWHQVGYDSETREIFGKKIIKHSKELFADMLKEADQEFLEKIRNVNGMQEQVAVLSQALQIDVAMDNFENVSLLIQESHLKLNLKELEKIKAKRLEDARKLLEKENDLCHLTDSHPKGLDRSLPSEEELENFNNYLTKKETELDILKSKFKEMRKSIIEMVEKISYKLTLDFDRLVCEEYHNFIFSTSNMSKLQELYGRIKDEYDSMKEQADNKRQELVGLWKFLGVSKKKYQEFLKTHSDFSTSTIQTLNCEIRRCKELRKENIANFVLKLREELTTWWDVCKFSQSLRNAFQPFHCTTFNEDTLALHEIELERVRQFYEENKPIFELLNKREELWNQWREIERRAEDPGRFNNRGGQLLMEEKKRNQYKKNAPKIDTELAELINIYEKKHKKPFTINGLTFAEYIEEQQEEHHAEMEQLKVDRARAKDEKKSAKKTPLSASRRTPGMATSLRVNQTSVKRKNISPRSGGSKNPRLAVSENIRPKAHGSKIRRSGVVSRKLLMASFSDNKDPPKKTPKKTSKMRNSSHNPSPNISKVVTQYEEFQEHLASRSELRSTLLSDANGPTRKSMKKPVKTPVKPTRKNFCQKFSPITPSITPKKLKVSESSKSPRITGTPRLTTAPNNVHNNF